MSDRPTPETDAVIKKWMQAPTPTPPEFIALARRLERQRNAAVETLKAMIECDEREGFITDAYTSTARAVLREIEEGK